MQLIHKNTKHVHTQVSKATPYMSKPETCLLRSRFYAIEKTAVQHTSIKICSWSLVLILFPSYHLYSLPPTNQKALVGGLEKKVAPKLV